MSDSTERFSDSSAVSAEIEQTVARLATCLVQQNAFISTAESCTGGLLAAALTSRPGSSDWFGEGIVSYSNRCKQSRLGVLASTLAEHGAVSEAVVREMAVGSRRCSGADIAVSISGIAGPGGAVADKPVGTVWFGFAFRTGEHLCVEAECQHFDGSRQRVRQAAVLHALRATILRLERAASD